MIPALLHSTFKLSLENDERKTEQALDIIDSWLSQFNMYPHACNTVATSLKRDTSSYNHMFYPCFGARQNFF